MGKKVPYTEITTILFIITIFTAIKSKFYLVGFFVLCYSLPFFPLVLTIFNEETSFWTGEYFIFSKNSIEIYGLSLVWLASCLGMLAGIFLQKFSLNTLSTKIKINTNLKNSIVKKWLRLNVLLIIITTLIISRLLIGGDAGGNIIFGGEMIICIGILLFINIGIYYKNSYWILIGFILTIAYIYTQLIFGDRDFFTIIIALMILFVTTHKGGNKAILSVGLLGMILLSFGALIAMLRMDVDVTLGEFVSYLYFNSWTATIQPVILMISAEWVLGPTLYGKTYLDLLTSILPSFFFSIFDYQKPISVDNPALWYYVENMGGMHAVGVAWRNFGIIGVFFQCLFFILLLAKLEKSMVLKNKFWIQFLYLTVASQVMHTTWYSLITMINSLVLFSLIYIYFSIEKILNSYGVEKK